MKNFNLILFLSVTLLLTASCNKKKSGFSGYIDADYIYISAYESGKLENVFVSRGDKVKLNQKLFKTDSNQTNSILCSIKNINLALKYYLKDMETPARIEKINTFEELRAAIACIHEGIGIGYQMNRDLSALNAVPKRNLWITDHLHTASEELEKSLENWVAYLKQSSGRPSQILAVNSLIEATNSQITYYKWLLRQTEQQSPYNALVFDVLYRKGEYVQQGRPVLVLLPPENLKIKFFVDGNNINKIIIGDPVKISVSGIEKTYKAKVTYISNKAEYTEPYIYSLESNKKLVYLVEAVPDKQDNLHPGQPVNVNLALD